MFTNKKQAGIELANKLTKLKLNNVVLIAIPRGGVEVADPIAQSLDVPIHVIIPRKIGVPFNQEYAVGALAPDGSVFLDDSLLSHFNITKIDLTSIIDKEMQEIKIRMLKYKPWSLLPNLNDTSVILVDDGIATGHTVKAAIKSIKNEEVKELILAIPILPHDSIDEFKSLVNKLIYLESPRYFQAVGQFYEDFSQTSHDTVLQILSKHAKNKDKV